MSPPSDDATLTVSPNDPAQEAAHHAAPYLLVVEGNSSILCPLPPSGELLIGRADDCGLRLSDRTASRHHARLRIDDDGITLIDLGSHNGTKVLGQRVVGSRMLLHGDVIQLCDVTLVLHAPRLSSRPRELQPMSVLRQRLTEEVERSLRYGRPLALLCLQIDAGADVARLSLVLGQAARLLDVISREDQHVWLLLPELSADERTTTVAELMQSVLRVAKTIRGGLASFPVDGGDPDSLLLSARTASSLAKPGECLSATEAHRTQPIGPHEVTIADPAMQRIYALLERLAKSPIPVLIQGETGTGKEIAATALHVWSKRPGRFVALNCAALPETLAESELFGHEKGAFTGAVSQKLGLLEQAAQGTLFLDEVGELPLSLQAKLLRALESQKITRVGGSRELPIDVRVVCATHRDLEHEVQQGRFRQDLFFRLVAARVMLPPLRDRRREIPLLLRQFLRRAADHLGRSVPAFSDGALTLLLSHTWPGNIRELRNFCDYLAATSSDGIITSTEVSSLLRQEPRDRNQVPTPAVADQIGLSPNPTFRSLEDEIRELEQRRMMEALAKAQGVQVRAAELLGMPIRTFSYKMKQYGISATGKSTK